MEGPRDGATSHDGHRGLAAALFRYMAVSDPSIPSPGLPRVRGLGRHQPSPTLGGPRQPPLESPPASPRRADGGAMVDELHRLRVRRYGARVYIGGAASKNRTARRSLPPSSSRASTAR
uniref:Uncharacterized protein n=1 Tax=Arundo donax TaxID=35708 RepID=A0A0A9C2N6_ARUDO